MSEECADERMLVVHEPSYRSLGMYIFAILSVQIICAGADNVDAEDHCVPSKIDTSINVASVTLRFNPCDD